MKTQCTEGTTAGELVTLSYSIPDQQDVDDGQSPRFVVDVLALLVAEENKSLAEKCVGLFEVDATTLFLDEALNAEEAETVAQWLELTAQRVREKFASR